MSARDQIDLSPRVVTSYLRLIRLAAVLQRVGLGRTAIYELIANGSFPEPFKSGRASLWREDEVEAWIRGLSRVRGATCTQVAPAPSNTSAGQRTLA